MKLGPVLSGIERREQRAALAREAYQHAREEVTDRVRAGLAALWAAAERDLGHELRHIHERDGEPRHEQAASADAIKARPDVLRARERPGAEREPEGHEEPAHELDSIAARLRAMWARERRPVPERPDPLALVAERPRDEDPTRPRSGRSKRPAPSARRWSDASTE